MIYNIVRLGAPTLENTHGFESGKFDIMYSYLMQKHNLTLYNHIVVNVIRDNLEEIIWLRGRQATINIRANIDFDFYEKGAENDYDKKRLQITHEALGRIAERSGKIDKNVLDIIQDELINKDFSLEIPISECTNKFLPALSGKVILVPEYSRFLFFASILENGVEKCRLFLYAGKTTDFYFDDLFSFCKWKDANILVISGRNRECEFHIDREKQSMELLNLSRFEKPPFFQMMRAGLNETQQARAYEDWIYLLPPAYATIIRNADN